MDEQQARLEKCLIDYADQKSRAADIENAILEFASNEAAVSALLTGFEMAIQESTESFLELNKLGVKDHNTAILEALKIKERRAANG